MIVFTVLLPYYLVIKTDFVHFMEHALLNSAFTDWVVTHFRFRVQHCTFPLSPTGKKMHLHGCSSCFNGTGHHAVRCVRELGGHGGHFTASGVRARSSFGKIDLQRRWRNEKTGFDHIYKGMVKCYACVCLRASECVGGETWR